MIRIKVVKPGKWIVAAVAIIGVLTLGAGIRSFYRMWPAQEVFSQQDTEITDDGRRLMDSLLKAVLDKAMPAVTAGRQNDGDGSFFKDLFGLVTRLNYKDH